MYLPLDSARTPTGHLLMLKKHQTPETTIGHTESLQRRPEERSCRLWDRWCQTVLFVAVWSAISSHPEAVFFPDHNFRFKKMRLMALGLLWLRSSMSQKGQYLLHSIGIISRVTILDIFTAMQCYTTLREPQNTMHSSHIYSLLTVFPSPDVVYSSGIIFTPSYIAQKQVYFLSLIRFFRGTELEN